MPKDQNEKPVNQIRSGALAVAIWKREHKDGHFYTVTPSRSYLDGEEWKYSDSLNESDCPTMAALLQMAFAWITNERAKEKANENTRRQDPR